MRKTWMRKTWGPRTCGRRRRDKRAISQTFETIGLRAAIQYGSEACAIMDATGSPEAAEFDRIRRADGLGAALKWRDSLFAPFEQLSSSGARLHIDGMTISSLRIGTRSSPMALAQTHLVRDRLAAAHRALAAPGAMEVVAVTTVADKVLDRPLAEIGGKGLFTKELEQSLLDRRIDIAVHSMKDVETWLPDGLAIACILPRDDPRDALLSHRADSLAKLAAGSRVGTSSLRRAAQVLMRRPDLRIVPMRGNANTRIRKLADGECDATLLALCGLQRIGMEAHAKEIISTDEMLPAVAQGALGIECRAEDAELRALLSPLACPTTTACINAERAFLAALDGTCRTPVAALATIQSDRLSLRAMLFTPDGKRHWEAAREGAVADAAAIGEDAGRAVRAEAGDVYQTQLR
jgi:hydroxymethylbilane synthase